MQTEDERYGTIRHQPLTGQDRILRTDRADEDSAVVTINALAYDSVAERGTLKITAVTTPGFVTDGDKIVNTRLLRQRHRYLFIHDRRRAGGSATAM